MCGGKAGWFVKNGVEKPLYKKKQKKNIQDQMSAEHLRLLLRSGDVFFLIGVSDAIKWNALILPVGDMADFRCE